MRGGLVAILALGALASTSAWPAPSAGLGLELNAVVDAGLSPRVVAEVESAWAALLGVVPPTPGTAGPSTTFRLTVRPAFALPPQVLARSSPGTIELRLADGASDLDVATRLALRHEVVHQFLWRHCAPATRDRLFHEALAVALSGESTLWTDAGYLATPAAAAVLEKADLDTPAARRALARLVTEGGQGALPSALSSRLARCADDAPWAPLTVAELAGEGALDVKDALVVLDARSGELLERAGAPDHAQPFGSTLKPFVIAAAVAAGRATPTLPVPGQDPQWACGATMPSTLDVAGALQRSCNGWFLALEAAQGPAAVELGDVGEVLLRLGLNRLPADMSEAIGVRTGLTLSARGLAEAWRLLALTTPAPGQVDVVDVLRTRGTLADLPGLDGLDGMAAKTGTVRDVRSRPVLGLLVAVDEELVIVRTRAGAQARALVEDVVAARRRHAGRARQPVNVQVFGLLPEHAVEARCEHVAVTIDVVPRLATSTSLSALVGRGRAACARGPWRVTPGQALAERPYAGVFARSPAPPSPTTDATATPRQRAARRGSDVVFSTSRARYVEGVLQAEDDRLRGEARVALARVIDHNVDHADERHGRRPVCDTTHCQTFKGTPLDRAVDGGVLAGIARPLSATGRAGWLPFSQGGTSPWQEERPAAAVTAALGAFSSLTLQGDVVVVVRPTGRDATLDEPEGLPCERLRSKLRLPSCPASADRRGEVWIFAGQGAGHGLGLDVERARLRAREGASADAILDEAYPPAGSRSTTSGR